MSSVRIFNFWVLEGEFSTQIQKKTGLKGRKERPERQEIKGKGILRLSY